MLKIKNGVNDVLEKYSKTPFTRNEMLTAGSFSMINKCLSGRLILV